MTGAARGGMRAPRMRNGLAASAIFLVAAAWGASFTVIHDILGRIAPEPFIAWRFTIAGAILLAVAARRRELRREILFPGLLLGAFVFVGYWAQTHGLLFISPPRSAFLTGLYVVMVPFADRAVYGTRVGLHAWVASLLAVVGTAAMIGGFASRPTTGDLLTVGCAATFALHVVCTARWSVQHPAIGLAAVQVLVVGLAAIPASLFAPRPRLDGAVVGVILFTAVVTTALAFVALMWGQARVSATEAAVILSFEPVAASITSVVWDHEPLTGAFFVGAALILAAMIVSQLPSASMRRDGTHPRHE